jgi:hypothetical protein
MPVAEHNDGTHTRHRTRREPSGRAEAGMGCGEGFEGEGVVEVDDGM